MLTLIIKNATRKFPISWLRENCRCSTCFFEQGHQRLLEPYDPLLESALLVSHELTEDVLKLIWNDGHRTEYRIDWLLENGNFQKGAKLDDFDLRKPWTTKSLEAIPKFDYSHVMSGKEKRYNRAIAEYGVFLITGAPTIEETVTSFAKHISLSGVRSTNFGTMFELKLHSHKNMKLAFTNKRISLHNDLLIRRQPPTVTLLHCLSQSGSGGESLIADGVAVALHMRQHDPAMYEILTEAEVEVEDVNEDWHYISRRPVISVENDRIKCVQFNNWERSANIGIDVERYDIFRRAYKKFSEYAHSSEFCKKHQLMPGEIIVVDNTRLLHGREAFEESEGYTRHLQGCHIDVDDLISMHRKTAL